MISSPTPRRIHPARRPQPKPTSAKVVPYPIGWQHRLVARAVFLLVHSVSATLRYRWTDRSGHFDGTPPGPTIYCVWHNRLSLSMIAYFNFVKKRNQTRGLAAMVSASRDGGFLAGMLEAFGVQPIRGSTSRRGRQALLELTHCAQDGFDVAITPDGPRGPRYFVQDGVISLAQLTGLPIIPVTYNVSWKFRVRSWDRFQIPLPFSRCEMIYERPIRVPREATAEEREALRKELETRLREMTKD